MTRNARTRVLTGFCAAVCIMGSAPSAGAPTSVATLPVNVAVTSNCVVSTQPAALDMTYDTVQNTGTRGTSSFTYVCTKASAVAVTPASTNGSNWEALSGTNDLIYQLYNDSVCAANQLTNGTAQVLSSGVGAVQTYDICAIPSTTLAQNLPAGTYTDTVTFTFNFLP